MAIINNSSNNLGNVQIVTWGPMANGDTGQPYENGARLSDKCVQIFGTAGTGGVITMQGSNDPRVITAPSSAIWFTLTDPSANTIVGAALGEQIIENPRYIRPNVTAGDGSTSLTAIICAKGPV